MRRVPPHVTIALAAFGFTVVCTPIALFGVDSVLARLGEGLAPRALIMAITAALAVAVALAGYAVETDGGARLVMLLGGAAGGVANAALCMAALRLFGGSGVIPSDGLVGGAVLGGLFGAMLTPAVLAAKRARRTGSLDANARVVIAAALAALACGVVVSPMQSRRSPMIGVDAAVVGLAMAASIAWMVRLALIERRARSGRDPALNVVEGTRHPDELAAPPLFADPGPLTSIVVTRGASSPHRGDRGSVRVARIPTSTEGAWSRRFFSPFARAFWSLAFTLIAAAVALFVLAIGSLLVADI